MRGLLDDTQAATLEPLRALVVQQESVLEAAGVSKSSVILSWTLTTQSVGEVLAQARRLAPASPTVVIGPVVTASPLGAAAIHCGALNVPYYLLAAQAANPFPALTGFWTGAGGTNLTQFNPVPVVTSTETIPLLLSVPRAAAPAGGWPVAIFQHGITRSRADMLAVADALASAGFAVVAIDAPLHGQRPDEALYAPRLPPPCATGERTFDIDFATGGVPGAPDGSVDPSGTHFINLASPLTTRDNVRQAAADLVTLTRAAGRIDLDGDGNGDLDGERVRFVGHSLGSLIGGAFLGIEPDIGTATLSTPTGGMSKTIDGSASLGPSVAAALAANGVVKGTQAYEDFLRVFQTVADSADPINYAGRALASRAVLAMEVVGGNTSPPDQVVPNDVLEGKPPIVAPDTIPGLGGTEPYAAVAGLSPVDGPVSGTRLKALLRFTAGHHSSFLTPRDADGGQDPLSAAVNREMQTLMATFLATGGTSIPVSDATLLAPVAE
jgi:pimeloyl-ACP methyl ester carboxylesterase